MRVKKMQVGGIMPYTAYTGMQATAPTAQAAQAAAAASTSAAEAEEGKEGLLSEKMMLKLIDNGLTSDVEATMERVTELQYAIATGASPDEIKVLYNEVVPLVTKTLRENEYMKEITSELNKNGGMSEAAITSDERVYVYKTVEDDNGNKGQVLSVVSLNEYREGLKDGTMRSVTNNELRSYRARSRNFAFNSDMMNALANGTGAEGITNGLKEVVSMLKKNSRKEESLFSGEDVNALNAFYQIEKMKPEEQQKLYESLSGSILSMTVEESSNMKNIKEAMSYMMSMMRENVKTLMKVKAMESGQTVEQVMLNYIRLNEESSSSRTWDISKNPGKGSNESEGDGDVTGSANLSTQEKYANNMTLRRDYEFNAGTNWSVRLPGFRIYNLNDSSEKPLDKVISVSEITNNFISDIIDSGNVWMNDKRLSVDEQKKVVSTGEYYAKVYMPLDMEAKSKGQYKPNLEITKRISEAEQYIIDKNIPEQQKADVYREFGIEQYFTKNITNSEYFAPFFTCKAVFQGDSGIKDNMNEDYEKAADVKDEEPFLRAIAKAISGHGGETPKHSKYDENSWWKFWNEAWYGGMVYIHTDDDKMISTDLVVEKKLKTPNSIDEQMKINEHKARQQNTRAGINELGLGR